MIHRFIETKNGGFLELEKERTGVFNVCEKHTEFQYGKMKSSGDDGMGSQHCK